MSESTGRDIISQVNHAHVTVASFHRHQVFYQYALGPETSYRNQTIIPGCVEHDNLLLFPLLVIQGQPDNQMLTTGKLTSHPESGLNR